MHVDYAFQARPYFVEDLPGGFFDGDAALAVTELEGGYLVAAAGSANGGTSVLTRRVGRTVSGLSVVAVPGPSATDVVAESIRAASNGSNAAVLYRRAGRAALSIATFAPSGLRESSHEVTLAQPSPIDVEFVGAAGGWGFGYSANVPGFGGPTLYYEGWEGDFSAQVMESAEPLNSQDRGGFDLDGFDVTFVGTAAIEASFLFLDAPTGDPEHPEVRYALVTPIGVVAEIDVTNPGFAQKNVALRPMGTTGPGRRCASAAARRDGRTRRTRDDHGCRGPHRGRLGGSHRPGDERAWFVGIVPRRRSRARGLRRERGRRRLRQPNAVFGQRYPAPVGRIPVRIPPAIRPLELGGVSDVSVASYDGEFLIFTVRDRAGIAIGEDRYSMVDDNSDGFYAQLSLGDAAEGALEATQQIALPGVTTPTAVRAIETSDAGAGVVLAVQDSAGVHLFERTGPGSYGASLLDINGAISGYELATIESTGNDIAVVANRLAGQLRVHGYVFSIGPLSQSVLRAVDADDLFAIAGNEDEALVVVVTDTDAEAIFIDRTLAVTRTVPLLVPPGPDATNNHVSEVAVARSASGYVVALVSGGDRGLAFFQTVTSDASPTPEVTYSINVSGSTTVFDGEFLQLDAAGTSVTSSPFADCLGEPLEYLWDAGDGSGLQSGTGSTPTTFVHRYSGFGEFPLQLQVRVQDKPHCGVGVYEASIVSSNRAPTVSGFQVLGGNVIVNETAEFRLEASDPAGGDLVIAWRFGDGAGSETRTIVGQGGVDSEYQAPGPDDGVCIDDSGTFTCLATATVSFVYTELGPVNFEVDVCDADPVSDTSAQCTTLATRLRRGGGSRGAGNGRRRRRNGRQLGRTLRLRRPQPRRRGRRCRRGRMDEPRGVPSRHESETLERAGGSRAARADRLRLGERRRGASRLRECARPGQG